MEPLSVTCDFEKALHEAVHSQFGTKSVINGCLFHWKQAIRRKMLKLHIKEEQVSMAMEKNVMDILTIIPRNEVRTTGIAYVMSILDPEITSEVDKMKWSEF